MHRARMIWILLVDPEQNFGGFIGMFSRNSVRWRGGEVGQSIESAGFRVVWKCFVDFFHRRFPSANPEPVVRCRRFEKKRLRCSDEELLPFRRRVQPFRLLNFIPTLLEVL